MASAEADNAVSTSILPSVSLAYFAFDDQTRAAWKRELDSKRFTTIFDRGFVSQSVLPQYKLPTAWYYGEMKRKIVDPALIHQAYELPTTVNRDIRDAPTSGRVTDPVVDPGQNVAKVTLPFLMTIRHKKMKRHKLKKLRKRMRFVMRKRRAVKQRRKEQAMQEYERKLAKEAAEYDPEKYIEERMALARKSGWGIDVVAEYAKQRNTESVKKSVN